VKRQVIISGRGGQGVVFLTRVLAEAALAAGLEVLTAEEHGMAQRGGLVAAHAKLGAAGELYGPMVRSGTADLVLCLAPENLVLHGHFRAPEGRVYLNAAPAEAEGLCAQGAAFGWAPESLVLVPAAELARACGQLQAANLALLGKAAADGVLPLEQGAVEKALERLVPERYRRANAAALAAGWEYKA